MIIRPATPDDAIAMTALQNEVIAIGGTTAYQQPRRVEDVLEDYITSDDVVCTHVALDDLGGLIGFQTLGWWKGDCHIGTFVAPRRQRSGAGAELFVATCTAARTQDVRVITATIRADNVPGLGYYARRGFVPHSEDRGWALDDGRVVGRVTWILDL